MYGLVDVILEFVACAAVLSVSAILTISWHPLLERVREPCKAGILHPEQTRLLRLAGLAHAGWVAAVAIYIRAIFLLGLMLEGLPEAHFFYRALLNIYLAFVSVLGVAGLLATIYFLYKYRSDFQALFIVIKFKSAAHHRLPDLELQQRSHEVVTSPIYQVDTSYRGGNTLSDDNDNASRRRSIYEASLPRSDIRQMPGSFENHPRPSPHTLRPFSDNSDGLDEVPLTRCETCSEIHASTIPRATRALIREPLTPTSPTDDSDTWFRLISSQSRSIQVDGPHYSLPASTGTGPAEGESFNETSTVSDLGDDFPVELTRWDRAPLGTYSESTTMPCQTPLTTDTEPSGITSSRCSQELDGRKLNDIAGERSTANPARTSTSQSPGNDLSSNFPRPNISPAKSFPKPSPQRITTPPDTGSYFPPYESLSSAQPTCVMTDAKLVRFPGTEDTLIAVASPRLRLEIPDQTADVHRPNRVSGLREELRRQ